MALTYKSNCDALCRQLSGESETSWPASHHTDVCGAARRIEARQQLSNHRLLLVVFARLAGRHKKRSHLLAR